MPETHCYEGHLQANVITTYYSSQDWLRQGFVKTGAGGSEDYLATPKSSVFTIPNLELKILEDISNKFCSTRHKVIVIFACAIQFEKRH